MKALHTFMPWRIRPLRAWTQSLLCLAAGLLLGAGLLSLHRAADEARELAAAWPEDHSTLRLDADLPWTAYRQLLLRLQPGSWTAYRVHDSTAWVEGTLDDGFRDPRGLTLLPFDLDRGHPVALSRETTGLLRHRNRLYQVVGARTGFLSTNHILPLAALSRTERLPTHIRVRESATNLRGRLPSLAADDKIDLIDHQSERGDALRRLTSLRWRFTASTLIAALLVGMVLATLWTTEVEERKVEFALRRTLGATPSHIHRQLLGEAFWICGAPLLLGLLPYTGRIPAAPLLGAVAGGWSLLALVCAVPAHRAAHRPPAETLQHAS